MCRVGGFKRGKFGIFFLLFVVILASKRHYGWNCGLSESDHSLSHIAAALVIVLNGPGRWFVIRGKVLDVLCRAGENSLHSRIEGWGVGSAMHQIVILTGSLISQSQRDTFRYLVSELPRRATTFFLNQQLFLGDSLNWNFTLFDDLVCQILQFKPRDTTVSIQSAFFDRAQNFLSRSQHFALDMGQLDRLLIVVLHVKVDLHWALCWVIVHFTLVSGSSCRWKKVWVVATIRCHLGCILIELVEGFLKACSLLLLLKRSGLFMQGRSRSDPLQKIVYFDLLLGRWSILHHWVFDDGSHFEGLISVDRLLRRIKAIVVLLTFRDAVKLILTLVNKMILLVRFVPSRRFVIIVERAWLLTLSQIILIQTALLVRVRTLTALVVHLSHIFQLAVMHMRLIKGKLRCLVRWLTCLSVMRGLSVIRYRFELFWRNNAWAHEKWVVLLTAWLTDLVAQMVMRWWMTTNLAWIHRQLSLWSTFQLKVIYNL